MLGSLGRLLAATPELRQRAMMQACLFGAFSLFWTAVPLALARYGLGTADKALFGLVGGTGALIAPLAGRAADRGRGRNVTLAGVLLTAAAFAASAALSSPWMLCACAILIGAGVQANLVVSQRWILSLHPEAGHRLNGLFVATFFLGGAAGSAAAVPLMAAGWSAVALVGVACAAGAGPLALRGAE